VKLSFEKKDYGLILETGTYSKHRYG